MLLLEAEGDELYGAMAQRLHELYPAAGVHRLTAGAHAPDASRVRDEVAAVLRFLADPGSVPPAPCTHTRAPSPFRATRVRAPSRSARAGMVAPDPSP